MKKRRRVSMLHIRQKKRRKAVRKKGKRAQSPP